VGKSKFEVRLLRVAEDDFTDIVEYVMSEHPKAAASLANRIEKNLQLLSKNPYLGKTPEEEELIKLGYRYLIVENYLIFYTIEEKTILVHRILHGARDYLRLF